MEICFYIIILLLNIIYFVLDLHFALKYSKSSNLFKRYAILGMALAVIAISLSVIRLVNISLGRAS